MRQLNNRSLKAILASCLLVSTLFCSQFHTLGAQDSAAPKQVTEPRSTPLSPLDSTAEIEIADGYRVELVACEPAVIDPVAVRFDHRGRMWVVEMRDYPTSADGGLPAAGTVKILEDRDGDGFFEWHRTFASGLNFPTGLQPFKDGVIVTVAGQILYLADTNHDGQCDVREVWFTGFSEDNEQLRANHPTWTLECEIHVASGLRGGAVQAVDSRWQNSEEALSLVARDFVFSPWGGVVRAAAGDSQFGYYQDDRGRQYICSNRNPCDLLTADVEQVVLNPQLPIATWRTQVMPAGEASRVFPLVNAWTTSNLHAGQFTAACGVFRYESDLLNELDDDFFACEPTGSLVQRYQTIQEGLIPRAEAAHENCEFLASRDPWFRPVDLIDGPDGAIYVVDMHRAVIEHPAWMPEELRTRKDLRWGSEAGRIYRVLRENNQRAVDQKVSKLFELPAEQWPHYLNSSNRWLRSTAARKLVEQINGMDESTSEQRRVVVASLQEYIDQSAADPAHNRGIVRALWILHHASALNINSLNAAQANPSVDVRLQVVRLLALHAPSVAETQPLHDQLLMDEEVSVRYQWLLEFARRLTVEDVPLIIGLLRDSATFTPEETDWLSRAISLVPDTVGVELIVARFDSASDDDTRIQRLPKASLLEPILQRLGWQFSIPALQRIAESSGIHASNDAWVRAAFDQYAHGYLERQRGWSEVLAQLASTSPIAHSQVVRWLNDDLQTVADESLPMVERVASLHRIRTWDTPAVREMCRHVLVQRSDALFVEVVPVLQVYADDVLVSELIDRLTELPRKPANAVIEQLVSSIHLAPTLLDALESNRLPLKLIEPQALGRLERHPNSEIVERLQQLKGQMPIESKQALIAGYSDSLDDTFDLDRGHAAFQRHCASCHRINNEGVAVGPDISDMRTQTTRQVLESILNPNQAIDANYFRYSVITAGGQVIDGLLVDSSTDSITLKMNEGVVRTIDRSSIDQVRASGVSMMPEGFENQIDPTTMNDLIHYLKRWRLMSANIPLD